MRDGRTGSLRTIFTTRFLPAHVRLSFPSISHGLSDLMTVQVVVGLEAIDIEKDRRKIIPGLSESGDFLLMCSSWIWHQAAGVENPKVTSDIWPAFRIKICGTTVDQPPRERLAGMPRLPKQAAALAIGQ